MTRVLLVTNDFPPRSGGIQSYLEQLVTRLSQSGAHQLTVYAPRWKGAPAYDEAAAAAGIEIVRHPGTLMLPVPTVDRRMCDLIADRDIDTVWFGAAAPLALLGPSARRSGAGRVVASTHGHEVGWSMLPVARSALRRIGESSDVVTYVSRYTRPPRWSMFPPVWTATGSGRTRRPVPSCGRVTGSVSARPWCVCPGWYRVRARTC